MKIPAFFGCLFLLLMAWSCEKDDKQPPVMELKRGPGFAANDSTIGRNRPFKVGVIATKTDNELETYNISRAFDGATNLSTFQTYALLGTNRQSFAYDTTLYTRNAPGLEKWVFTITDNDGKFVQRSITLNVQ